MSHFRPRQHNLFQSTPPVRGATRRIPLLRFPCAISIHAPRAGGDDDDNVVYGGETDISIHAPRAGGDGGGIQFACIVHISIHAPRAGGDVRGLRRRLKKAAFQSTPPVRGATISSPASVKSDTFQSTPPVRGATECGNGKKSSRRFQSTPPVRGATARMDQSGFPSIFQSTPPVRGATSYRRDCRAHRKFQSTPPVRGATRARVAEGRGYLHFNPRPPCGGRPVISGANADLGVFQSTPPVRGATQRPQRQHGRHVISIHAPRAGGDVPPLSFPSVAVISIHAPRAGGDATEYTYQAHIYSNFNPRPPCGGRLVCRPFVYWYREISIHAPRAGGDVDGTGKTPFPINISIHAPRAGGDVNIRVPLQRGHDFNPRPPCGGRRSIPPSGGWQRLYFNPRPPCGGRRRNSLCCQRRIRISIHAPRAGGDAKRFRTPTLI